ncbi:MAG: cyclic nucleotide-binding domain-containing protein [Burkholderiales bacterium]|nr:cyclic nucleotide-binding domain-containing protein [Burkholderiales bacterium]
MNVDQLVDAVNRLERRDALQCKLAAEEWKALAPYLSVRFLRVGEAIVHEGEDDREVFIVAEGEVDVSVQGHVIASLGPGNVVGECAFFSGLPRSATVTPVQPGVAWALNWQRFDLLAHKHPRLAVHLLKGLATVMAVRMREAVLVEQFA